jgi:uncharacterized protein (TIGR03790 family)
VKIARIFCVFLAIFTVRAPIFADNLGDSVLVVYNSEMPEARELAEYYAARRNVPAAQIVALKTSAAEEISRKEFNDQIRVPLIDAMSRLNLWRRAPITFSDPFFGDMPALTVLANRIRYIVLIRGVPLRIREETIHMEARYRDQLPEHLRRTAAAVDSELALLPMPFVPATGPLRNPYYLKTEEFGRPDNLQMLIVARLDGPSVKTVRAALDNALAAERYGLHGRAYFDAQGTTDKGYVIGDNWVRGAHDAALAAGYDCELDMERPTFPADFPMTDAAIYVGWYALHVTGPMAREDFRFRTGAIAYHIHSSSAVSVRSTNEFWVGPLVERGASATMGCVYEPYLQLSPNIGIFIERLLAGARFGDAAYACQPVLSWQNTIVGDPLYQPFQLSIDEQIANLEADKIPDIEWAYARKMNLLTRKNERDAAEKLALERAERTKNPIWDEKLGEFYANQKRWRDAASAYLRALDGYKDEPHRLRAMKKLAEMCETAGDFRAAIVVWERFLEKFPRFQGAEIAARALETAQKAKAQKKSGLLQTQIEEWSKRERKSAGS